MTPSKSISAWLLDWSLVTITGGVLPPRDPNDDDDEEDEDQEAADQEEKPPVIREPESDE